MQKIIKLLHMANITNPGQPAIKTTTKSLKIETSYRGFSSIDQEIERAKTIINSPRDELNRLQAHVTLAELENLRYEVEGKLAGFMTE